MENWKKFLDAHLAKNAIARNNPLDPSARRLIEIAGGTSPLSGQTSSVPNGPARSAEINPSPESIEGREAAWRAEDARRQQMRDAGIPEPYIFLERIFIPGGALTDFTEYSAWLAGLSAAAFNQGCAQADRRMQREANRVWPGPQPQVGQMPTAPRREQQQQQQQQGKQKLTPADQQRVQRWQDELVQNRQIADEMRSRGYTDEQIWDWLFKANELAGNRLRRDTNASDTLAPLLEPWRQNPPILPPGKQPPPGQFPTQK